MTDGDPVAPDPAGLTRTTYGIGGAALSALTGGPDDGDVVVLLHGLPSSAELWRGVGGRLAAAGWRVVAFDLPGYGHTLVPAGADHSLAGAAELVATWIRVEAAGPVWLVGHDLGGGVAQILASRYPTLLCRLTLVDSVHGDGWPVPQVRLLRAVARAHLYPALAALRLFPGPVGRAQLRRGFADPARVGDRDLARVFWDTKVSSGEGRHAFARHVAALDSRQTSAVAGNLSRLTVPTQVLWGRDDVLLPWEPVGRSLAERLPTPATTAVAAGHYGPLEAPDALTEALAGGG